MTSSAWLLLVFAGIAAVVDWWAIAMRNRRVEFVSKPATLVLLIGTALALDPDVSSMRTWFVVALVFSLAGDVFLMLPRDLFLPGLGSFLVAHLAYIAGFVALGIESDLLPILIPVAVLVVLYARYLIVNMSGPNVAMRVPVALYAVAIGTMLVFALASGSVVAAAGAILFITSDGLIGYSRFVRSPGWAPVAIIVTYHLGQAGLVLGLVFT